MHPGTGEIWQNENGPNGGDEINILKPGGNYGWPLVSLGRTYQGPWQSQKFQQRRLRRSGRVLDAAIAVSGIAFYTGDKLPKWKGDVFVGVAAHGRDPRHRPPRAHPVQREDGRAAARVAARGLAASHARRASKGPDGLLYVLTDDDDGAVLRIEPAS